VTFGPSGCPVTGQHGQREEVVTMVVREQVNIIMAELNGDIRVLLNDLDRGLIDREQAARILALTLDNAKQEIMATLPRGAPGAISYRAG
jgi:hypothetical protein